MNGEVRRTFEMTARVDNFSDAHPDTDAGHAVSVGRLKQVKAQMEQVAALQRAGLIDVHTGATEKRRLRREAGRADRPPVGGRQDRGAWASRGGEQVPV